MRAPFFGAALMALILVGAPAAAQTTGSINGTIVDNTDAVLPGVTVTATSPAMMGAQVVIANERGQYRFPSLTPGRYKLTFELQSTFAIVVREDIVVSIGFTATVNVEMVLATVQETVTVTGASPLVDVQNTNLQTNFTAESLKNIPNGRDVWALIAVTPGMMMTQFDVGGSRVGNQTGYSAYGLTGQVRAQVDGVNTTESTGGTAGYFDYSSFEEVQIGTDSNDASMPTPGVRLNAVLKSGGNTLKGDLYVDYENENLQGRNVTDDLRRLGVGEGSRITKYFDPNFNLGGPIKKDRLWYFGSVRSQRIGTTVTGFPADRPTDFESLSLLDALTYKLTWRLSQNNKLSQYMQGRRKVQPYRDAGSTRYADAAYKQQSTASYGNLAWNRIVSPKFYFDTTISTWGYNWPNIPYGADGKLDENLRNRMSELTSGNVAGGAFDDRRIRRRYQFDWQGVLFADQWAGADHSLKLGYLTEWENDNYHKDGYKDAVLLTFNSPVGSPDFTRPYRVSLYNDPTTAFDALWHHGAYVQDQIKTDSLTINAGLRWDYYSVYYPDETIDDHRFRDFFYAGAALPNGYSIPASYPDFKVPGRDNIFKYNKAFGPRLGLAWNLRADGKTVLKASWGRYYFNPGPRGSDVNPIQSINYTFGWNDLNGDKLFTLNELGSFVSNSGGVSNTIKPGIGHPYGDDFSAWVEHEIAKDVSGRVGVVYKRVQNDYQNVELARVASLYTGKVQAFDPGPDGLTGTPDDKGAFTVFDVPAGVTLPASKTQLDTPEGNDRDYTSIDASINKRMTSRWSLVSSFLYTWSHSLRVGVPQNPNDAVNNELNTTQWAFKAFATYRGPWEVVISPVVRHQSGDPLGRVVQVTGLRTGTLNAYVESNGSYREDNVTLFDTRVEKRFALPRKQQLSLFFDVFNITNSNASESEDNTIGRRTVLVGAQTVDYQRFLRPTAIIGPRIYRFGLKYAF